MELLIAIPAAVGLGAMHFLEPGHGKGVMTAYLISSRARVRDAVTLAFTAALSHTFSIFLLALLATSAFQFLLPHQVEGWLGLVSGAIITFIGSKMVYQRLFPPVISLGGIRRVATEGAYVCEHGHVHPIGEYAGHDDHGHDHSHQHNVQAHDNHNHDYNHSHNHSHNHHHGHTHDHHHHGRLPHVHFDDYAHEIFSAGSDSGTAVHTRAVNRLQASSLRRLLTIGVLAGLIPCPSALAMLLAAASAGQVSYGIGMVLAFSLGGALSLSLLGILLLRAEKTVKFFEGRHVTHLMATLSALLIVVLGFLVTYESILKLELL